MKQEQRPIPPSKVVSRRTFLASVTVVAGAVITGCGTTNPGAASGTSASGAAASGTSASGAASGTAAGGKVVLNQMYHQYGEAGTKEAVLRYAQEYTKQNPNVQVNVNWTLGDYAQKLNAALLTPQAPDLYEGGPTLDAVKQGQIASLDDLFTDEIKKDFNPIDLQANTINGKIYAIKMLADTGVLYYRKSLLDKAGVKPPTTMDELIDAAKKLNRGNVKGLYVGNDGGVAALATVAPWAAGSNFLQDNKIVFDNAQTAEAYRKVKELNDSGALLQGAPTDWWDPSAFTQGLTAMQWTGLWAMPAIQKALGDDFGIVPWPSIGAKGTPATFRGGWSQMVNAKGAHVDEAKKYAQWLWIQNTQLQQDWNLNYGFHVPPRISATNSADKLKSGAPAQAVEILNKYGKANPPTWAPAMDTAINDALTNVLKKGADPAAEVKTAAQKADAELKRLLG